MKTIIEIKGRTIVSTWGMDAAILGCLEFYEENEIYHAGVGIPEDDFFTLYHEAREMILKASEPFEIEKFIEWVFENRSRILAYWESEEPEKSYSDLLNKYCGFSSWAEDDVALPGELRLTIDYDLLLKNNPQITTHELLRHYIDDRFFQEIWDYCLEDRDEAERSAKESGFDLQEITLNGETRLWEKP